MSWSGPTEKARTWMASLLGWVWLPSLTSVGVPADQLPPVLGQDQPRHAGLDQLQGSRRERQLHQRQDDLVARGLGCV